MVQLCKIASAQKSPQICFLLNISLLNSVVPDQIFLEILEHIFRKHAFTKANLVERRSRWERSSRLPVQKTFSFIFLHIKMVLIHVLNNSLVVLQFSLSLFFFLWPYKPRLIFWLDRPWIAIELAATTIWYSSRNFL